MSAVVIGPPLPSPLRHGRPPDACGGHRGVKSRRFSAIFGKSGFLLGSTNLQLFISCSNKVLWRRRTRGRKRKGPRRVWIIGIMKNDIRFLYFSRQNIHVGEIFGSEAACRFLKSLFLRKKK